MKSPFLRGLLALYALAVVELLTGAPGVLRIAILLLACAIIAWTARARAVSAPHPVRRGLATGVLLGLVLMPGYIILQVVLGQMQIAPGSTGGQIATSVLITLIVGGLLTGLLAGVPGFVGGLLARARRGQRRRPRPPGVARRASNMAPAERAVAPTDCQEVVDFLAPHFAAVAARLHLQLSHCRCTAGGRSWHLHYAAAPGLARVMVALADGACNVYLAAPTTPDPDPGHVLTPATGWYLLADVLEFYTGRQPYTRQRITRLVAGRLRQPAFEADLLARHGQALGALVATMPPAVRAELAAFVARRHAA